MPTKSPARLSKPSQHPVRDAADALYRAARECCHQHERLSALNRVHADDVEFNATWDMAEVCEAQLVARTAGYEEIAAIGRGAESEEWWRTANALWHACREYARRHDASNSAASRRRRHGAEELMEISLEYELEASARMAVKQALEKYGQLRPDAA